jgi:hypothetical protein
VSRGSVRAWGVTDAERAIDYPCDRHVVDPDDEWYRATDVGAPVSTVYRWLCQLRVAPYSYDLIDNFGRRSPRTLTPGLEHLAVGQRVMRVFDLVEFERDRHLTAQVARARAMFGDTAVTYMVRPAAGGGTPARGGRLPLSGAAPAAPGLARALPDRGHSHDAPPAPQPEVAGGEPPARAAGGIAVSP